MGAMRWVIVIVMLLACGWIRAEEKAKSTQPATKPRDPLKAITQKEIDELVKDIDFELLPPDEGFVTPLKKDLDHLDEDTKKRLDEWTNKLNDWAGARDDNTGQRVRNLIAVMSLADLGRGEFEGESAYVIIEKLKSEVDKDELIKACVWIIHKPDEGKCPTKIPDLGWEEELVEEAVIRERSQMYAAKLLGRLMGKLPKE
jgi:hypothetical protein